MPEYHTCPFCGHRFTQEESATSCARCSLFGTGGCQKMRCPKCSYEMPMPARLPGLVKGMIKKLRGKTSTK